jgi:hypothetical protein
VKGLKVSARAFDNHTRVLDRAAGQGVEPKALGRLGRRPARVSGVPGRDLIAHSSNVAPIAGRDGRSVPMFGPVSVDQQIDGDTGAARLAEKMSAAVSMSRATHRMELIFSCRGADFAESLARMPTFVYPAPYDQFLTTAEQVVRDRPEVAADMVREIFDEVASMLYNGLVLDHLDEHDKRAAVDALCLDLTEADPGAAIRVRAKETVGAPGEPHDRSGVAAAYLTVLELFKI